MIERWKNDDGSETILITDDPPRPSFLQRVLGFIGKALLVLLVSLLPLYLLRLGIHGLVTEKLSMWSRISGPHTLYGSEAIGWSWMYIGFAFGFVPFVFREELARWIKWTLGLIATACFTTGTYHLLKGV